MGIEEMFAALDGRDRLDWAIALWGLKKLRDEGEWKRWTKAHNPERYRSVKRKQKQRYRDKHREHVRELAKKHSKAYRERKKKEKMLKEAEHGTGN